MVKLPRLRQFLVCTVWLLIATAPVSAQTPHNRFLWSHQVQQGAQGFYYQPVGLCEDYPQNARTQQQLDKDFAVMRAAGAKLLRVGISWQDIEDRPGEYDWEFWDRLVDTAIKNDIVLIPYVCYTPWWAASSRDRFWTQPPKDDQLFQDFMQKIAARYKGKVRSWELWNEPDNQDFWRGTAAQYAGLVQAGAKGVRVGDPHAVIVLGGMSGKTDFLRTLIDQYHIQDDVDVVNFHAYFETWNNYRIEHIPGYIEEMADAAGGSSAPPDLWLAEFGYSDLRSGGGLSDLPYQHTPQFQAVALLRSQMLALSTGKLSLTAWYRINDLPQEVGVIGDDNNRHLGIVDVDGRKKPAFYALRFYNQLFGEPVRCIDSDVKVRRAAGSRSIVHVFQGRDGVMIVAAWLRSPLPGDLSVRDSTDNRRETIAIRLPLEKGAKLMVYDASGQPISSQAALNGNVLQNITLTGPSIFIARISRAS